MMTTRCARLLLAAVLTCIGVAKCGAWEVEPLVVVLPAGESTASLTIRNPEGVPVTLDWDVHVLQQLVTGKPVTGPRVTPKPSLLAEAELHLAPGTERQVQISGSALAGYPGLVLRLSAREPISASGPVLQRTAIDVFVFRATVDAADVECVAARVSSVTSGGPLLIQIALLNTGREAAYVEPLVIWVDDDAGAAPALFPPQYILPGGLVVVEKHWFPLSGEYPITYRVCLDKEYRSCPLVEKVTVPVAERLRVLRVTFEENDVVVDYRAEGAAGAEAVIGVQLWSGGGYLGGAAIPWPPLTSEHQGSLRIAGERSWHGSYLLRLFGIVDEGVIETWVAGWRAP
jgi:hypothetical protein